MATRSTQSAYDIEMLRSERDSARAELDALRKRFAELEAAQAIVTPNNCRHCQRAAEKMREAAAGIVDELREDELISGIIRAMPLPACDGCNPLKPSDVMVNHCSSCCHPSTDHDADGLHPCGQCECVGYTPKVSLFA